MTTRKTITGLDVVPSQDGRSFTIRISYSNGEVYEQGRYPTAGDAERVIRKAFNR